MQHLHFLKFKLTLFPRTHTGHYCTTITALISIIVAFIESQITFCFLNRSQIVHRKEKCLRKNHRTQYIDDVNADEEYIIHKNDKVCSTRNFTFKFISIQTFPLFFFPFLKKTETNGSRKVSLDTTVQVYAKSWVFEGAGEDGYHQPDESLSVSLCSSTSPTHSNVLVNGNSPLQQHKQPQPPQKHNKTRRISKASDATSERFNQQMSSFSRCATPSPIPYSGQATPTNLYSDYLDVSSSIGVNQNHVHHQQTQKSNRLTIDFVPAPHPVPAGETVAVTVPIKHTSKIVIQSANGPPSISSQQDDSQYASMLAELEQSLIDKKIQPNAISPDDTSISTDKYGSSKSSSKDLEFSKELEAALQLIQELETPSEGPMDASANPTKFARSESEKTLSAAVSLPSPDLAPTIPKSSSEFQTPQNGKHQNRNIIHIEPSSQSTSGYSSPNSFTSNAPQLSSSSLSAASHHRDHIISADQSNVVRIYIEPSNGQCNTTINGNTNLLTKGHILNASNLIETAAESQKLQSNDSLNKSFLLFKKRSKLMPQTDFQNRIFKSECLAYLTDEELVARHRCNRDVIRVRIPFEIRKLHQINR